MRCLPKLPFVVTALLAFTLLTRAAGADPLGTNLDVPYVPTPQPIVDKMLELGKVGRNDFLIDLGSGDGRILVTAAKRFGTRGFGVDINPARIEEARANARKAGVADKVEFRQQDLFQTDIGRATVVTLYLLPAINARLKPRLLALRPGTRIVSHDFPIGDWQPTQTVKIGSKVVYLWIVPRRSERRAKAAPRRLTPGYAVRASRTALSEMRDQAPTRRAKPK